MIQITIHLTWEEICKEKPKTIAKSQMEINVLAGGVNSTISNT